MATGDAARIGEARAAVERLPISTDTELLVVPILAALGGTDAVLERLEASRRKRRLLLCTWTDAGPGSTVVVRPTAQADLV